MGIKVSVRITTGQIFEARIRGNKAIIGRSSKCDLVIPDESLSRTHAKIELENGSLFITDLASHNGIFLKGSRIEANERTLSINGKLTLGTLECTIEECLETQNQILHVSERKRETPSPEESKLKGSGKRINFKMILSTLVLLMSAYFFIK